MSEKFVLATHNPGKLKEMSAVLSGLGIEVVSPDELGLQIAVEETGETFAENAMLKAKAVCAAAKLPAIADDSGLCVDALNGGPGVYSARYGGEELDDRGRMMLLLNTMRGMPTRSAHFTCAIACAFPNGDTLTADFSESDDQARGPVNATLGVTMSAVYNAMYQLADDAIPRNAGCYRPITVIARPGSVLNVAW